MLIKKLSYSRHPWRLLTSDGREVSVKIAFDHSDIGMTVINGSVSGETKAECTAAALALLEKLISKCTEWEISDEEIFNSMKPELDKGDGGYLCDMFPAGVIAAGREVLRIKQKKLLDNKG